MNKYEIKVKKEEYKNEIKSALKSAGLKITRESKSMIVAKDAPVQGSKFVNMEEHEVDQPVNLSTVRNHLQTYLDYIKELYYVSKNKNNKNIQRYIVKNNKIVEK